MLMELTRGSTRNPVRTFIEATIMLTHLFQSDFVTGR